MPKRKPNAKSNPPAMPAQPQRSYLGLFRAGMTSPEHRRFITVARKPMLRDALEHLRNSMTRKSKHHLLYIGSRGTGKTHLLSLIEDEIAQDEALRTHIVVVRFPEESSRFLSFADFLLRVCEALAAQLPTETNWQSLYQKLETEDNDATIIDTLVPAIRQANRAMKRTVLIMLENVHDVFEKQMKERVDVGALRKFLMDDNGCQLIATAPIHFEGISSVDEPFFDFFDVQVLDLLTKDEAIELVHRNLEWENRTVLLDDFKTLRPKLAALHDMTAGNPRLTHMLYEMIVHDSIVEVGEQFKKLLDRVTPFYQDRLKELAPRERALLETLALMRDESEPKTPKRIAEKLRISEQQTSSLLKRLSGSGYIKSVQNPNDKRSRLYAINEGFFDLWLAMNLSRKHRKRLPILVECLAKFYPLREERELKRTEYRLKFHQDADAQAGLDLLSAIGTPPEQAQAKLDLAALHSQGGNQRERAEIMDEIRAMPLDSMGTWIVARVPDRELELNYLDEIQQLIELWSLHRSGDLEAFMERFAEMGVELNYKNYSEAKIAFLREHLALLVDPQKRIELRLRLGLLLKEKAHWSDAEAETREALEEAEDLQNPKWTAVALNNLAQLLQATNRLAEAEPLMRRALAIDEQSFGAEHPLVAIRLNNLAQLLQDTNRLAEAEPLMRRALAIDELSYGAEHPDVAIDLNNLAQLLQATNRLAEAEPLMRRALAIDEQSYGAEHPSVARDLNNLAQLLQDTNRLAEAEPLMRRALAIDEQSYGADHPSVARDLNNLAQLLKATNRLSEAEPLMARSFIVFFRSLGFEHPNTQTVRNNYISLLIDMGLSEAEAIAKIQAKLQKAES
ncbi:MAG: tetratricopeptide repeat protein [Pirellulaceae bacterium]|nr:tetratricopeptide repeat protein [Pirellulaceae bacterium]